MTQTRTSWQECRTPLQSIETTARFHLQLRQQRLLWRPLPRGALRAAVDKFLKPTRRSRNNRSGRQKISARNERRDSRAITNFQKSSRGSYDFVSCYFFRAIQCRASAGTRKKNTSTTRSWMKNSRTNLPNSFSSILKKCAVMAAPVLQKRSVTPK